MWEKEVGRERGKNGRRGGRRERGKGRKASSKEGIERDP